MSKFYSNEIVYRGHPDKICDQIGGALLNAYVKQDKHTRAGIEVTGGKGKIFITGEVTTKAKVNGKQPSLQNRIYDSNGISTAITTSFYPSITDNLKIRKLTPIECFRLMGFSDEDFESASQVNSNSQLYKQAGNSIVVNVLEAIFNKFIEITTWEPLVGVKSNIEQMSLF